MPYKTNKNPTVEPKDQDEFRKGVFSYKNGEKPNNVFSPSQIRGWTMASILDPETTDNPEMNVDDLYERQFPKEFKLYKEALNEWGEKHAPDSKTNPK